MKKIVSVLSVAALTLSAVFAADVSLSYKMAGTLYTEKTTKNYTTEGADPNATQTRTFLNLNGYAEKPTGDLAFTAKNDFAGFALTLNPKVDTHYTAFAVDTYYGWLNFAGLQLTTGKWSSRYVGLLDQHSNNWEDNEYARYKPGVRGGKYANDIDNLTSVNTDKNGKWEQRLATALAYTLRPNEDTAIMIKGVLVDSDWGSVLRTDSDRTYSDAYTKVTGGDIGFFSGFAGEFGFKTASFDANFVMKSMYRDEIALGAFFRTLGEDSSYLFGLSAGFDLTDQEVDHNYREFAFDFRAHKKLSEALCLTTMNNLTVTDAVKAKSQKYDDMEFKLWDMVSLGYNVNEKLMAQFTVESECNLLKIHANSDRDGNELDGPFSQGGFNITVIPGVKYSFNENATLTAGVALGWNEIGASPNWQDNRYNHTIYKNDGDTNPTRGLFVVSEIKIPVVFKVAL